MVKNSFFLLAILSIAGCGSPFTKEDTIGFTPDPMDKNPPKPLECDYPMMICDDYTKCVDVSKDRKNCGWCEIECDVGSVCQNYHCVDPTDYGYSKNDLLKGPVDYNIIKDLPRPTPNY